jgi:hypothetical protein
LKNLALSSYGSTEFNLCSPHLLEVVADAGPAAAAAAEAAAAAVVAVE